MLLDKDSHDGLHFLETALLAAQRKHLEPKNAGRGFRLHALPDRQGLLGQTLALFEAAPHQGPHGPKHCGEGKIERLVGLLRGSGSSASISASAATTSPDSNRQYARHQCASNSTSVKFAALRKVQHFCCDGKPLPGVLRPREGAEHSQEAVGDQSRVVKAPGHRHRLLGIYHRLLLLPRNSQRAGQTAKDFRHEGIVVRSESLQRFLEQANHRKCGKAAQKRRMYELQRRTDQVLCRS